MSQQNRICGNCGTSNSPQESFCTNCGYQLAQAAPQPPAQTQFAQVPSQPPVQAQSALLRDGRFRRIRRIGSGGMGAVFLAEDIPLEREVALKEISLDPTRCATRCQ